MNQAGAEMSDVVKVTLVISDDQYYPLINEIYKEYISYPYPTRTIIISQFEFFVQVDAIAFIEN
ncbi:RidA family protein [Paenibacillus sp. HJGM_3]|uniref:RidA family protein n=1 Tax=Paenibacillus sp. HJGM_3 TaxID=3379816 RepID=UPI00385D69E1